LLKLTCPGIPDVYQGTELWDESLVDPDNRRPVDFEARERMLTELEQGMSPGAILARMNEGLPKLWLLSQALRLREERPQSLSPTARYEPIDVRGDARERFIAFTRGGDIAVVAPRLVHLGGSEHAELTLGPGRYLNRLTGERFSGGSHAIATLLAEFPVALLVRD
jgi:(1->4)-alpha-D-glucan 1-alpha-D-glucosylmutase